MPDVQFNQLVCSSWRKEAVNCHTHAQDETGIPICVAKHLTYAENCIFVKVNFCSFGVSVIDIVHCLSSGLFRPMFLHLKLSLVLTRAMVWKRYFMKRADLQ